MKTTTQELQKAATTYWRGEDGSADGNALADEDVVDVGGDGGTQVDGLGDYYQNRYRAATHTKQIG
jgi:hypothetical protein